MNPHQPDTANMIDVLPGLSYRWLEQPAIIQLKLLDANRDTVDAWIQLSMDVRRTWDEQQPMLILLDITDGKFFPSPYVQAELNKLMKFRPEIRSFSAVVLAKNFTSHLIETMLRLAQRQSNQQPNRVFTSMEEALAWLHSMAAEFPKPDSSAG